MISDENSQYGKADLESEISILKTLGEHENILSFLGTCSQNGPLLLIMEFAPYGNMRHFLQSAARNLSTDILEKFSMDVARGMEYLVSREVRKYLLLIIFLKLYFSCPAPSSKESDIMCKNQCNEIS